MTTRRSNYSRAPDELEAVTWSGQTYQLPPKLSSTEINDQKKKRFFDATVDNIRSGGGSYQDKVRCLESRFTVGQAKRLEAEQALSNLYDTDTRDAPVVIHRNPLVFQLAEAQLADIRAGPLAMTAPNLTANQRSRGRFLTFQVTVNPTMACADCHVTPQTLDATVRLPTANNDIVAALDTAILSQPTQLLMVLEGMAAGASPSIGTISRESRDAVYATVNTTAFKKTFVEYFYQCVMDVMVQRLRVAYLGTSALQPDRLDLSKCRQLYFDTTTRRTVKRSVQEYYEDFLNTIYAFPRDQPYPIDIAATFEAQLEYNIRNMLTVKRHVVPPRPAGESNFSAQARLTTVKDNALAVERELAVLSSVAGRPTTTPTRSGGAAAFLAIPEDPYHPDDVAEAALAAGIPDLFHAGALPSQQPVVESTESTMVMMAQAQRAMTSSSGDELLMQAAVFASLAEEVINNALVKAGEALPRGKSCWGCNEPHLFRDCPLRNDPQVAQKVRQHLREWRERRRGGHQSDSKPQALPATTTMNPFSNRTEEVVSTWKEEGFPSEQAAVLMCQIVDPSTPAVTRQVVYQSLATSYDRNRSKKARSTPTKQIDGPGESSGGSGSVFSLIVIPQLRTDVHVFEAQMRQLDAALQVSQQLPHIRFPIGPTASPQGALLALMDTGAGLNLGRLSYHKSIAEQRPEIVHQFAYLKDLDNLRPFGLGGVHGTSDNDNDVEAVISYKTPYRRNGKPVVITVALGERVATNTILSLPFLVAIKASILFESMTLVSGVLGDSYKIDMMVPLRADRAPTITQAMPSSYAATPPDAYAALMEVHSELSRTMGNLHIRDEPRLGSVAPSRE